MQMCSIDVDKYSQKRLDYKREDFEVLSAVVHDIL